MIKRATLICFVFLILLTYTGCSAASSQAHPTMLQPTADITVCPVKYSVSIQSYTAYDAEHKPFQVKYAQVSGLDDSALEKKINASLKSAMSEWINEDCAWVEQFQITVPCKTSKYLSICNYIEWDNPKGTAFIGPYTRLGITIDMNTGKRIFLKELFKDANSLKKKLIQYDCHSKISLPMDPENAEHVMQAASMSEKQFLNEEYKTDKCVFICMKSYIALKPSFYLTNKELVITRDENNYNDVFLDYQQ